MSDISAAVGPAEQLPLTGERTVPGIPEENYWFRRHEVVYEFFQNRFRDLAVIEAGSGEGYGANMIAEVAESVVGIDYDTAAVAHVRATYPRITMLHGNLAQLPLESGSADAVVNFQVIEHLWDQPQFLRECHRVLRHQGELFISTPNRITFSPGRDTPLNPFHTRELDGRELAQLLCEAGFEVTDKLGVHHGPRLRELDASHGGSFIDAQITRSLAGEAWPENLTDDVASIETADFVVEPGDLDASLDLVFVARRSGSPSPRE